MARSLSSLVNHLCEELHRIECKLKHDDKFEKFKYISSKVLNIHATIKEKHARLTNCPSWVNSSKKRLWLGLIFLINLGKIIVPEISLPIKNKEIFVLSF